MFLGSRSTFRGMEGVDRWLLRVISTAGIMFSRRAQCCCNGGRYCAEVRAALGCIITGVKAALEEFCKCYFSGVWDRYIK